MRGGPRDGAGRPNLWGRGVRLEARTLRMPPEVWDRLDVFAKRETTTPSYAVAIMVAERSGAPGLLREDVAGEGES